MNDEERCDGGTREGGGTQAGGRAVDGGGVHGRRVNGRRVHGSRLGDGTAAGSEALLRVELRREADASPVGWPPIEEVVRRGRRARRRRAATTTGAVVAAALAVVGYGAVPELSRARPIAPPATSVPGPAPTMLSPSHVRTVEPDRAFGIGREVRVALMSSGRQSFVVGAEEIESGIAARTGRDDVGENIGANSVSTGYSPQWGLVSGAFRTDAVPRRIEVRALGGRSYTAALLRLPGDPGWGVYYAFVDLGPRAVYEVAAYASDGRVQARARYEMGAPDPPPR
ncbi:hypothetical protein [Streptomyces katsurahamanus]|uniref:Uncharacterized protein n=1 Tax=Streptomyces katsurahamanus TaxID=2577098 RepID=A0ABW9NTN4_9ACTN|nr:hypothetical protein [Streptomyces katsurahamanus]MQS36234.1 hypothetical protein [Streptomyces katsurahamanus]